MVLQKKMGKCALALSMAFGFALAAPGVQAADEYKGYVLESEFKIPGEVKSWDGMSFDEASGRVFLARRALGQWTFDPKTKKTMTIEDSKGSNGVALAPDLKKGFTSNGDGTSTVFDLKTLKKLAKIQVAKDNDANAYDAKSKRVIFVNADSATATIVDAVANKVAATVKLNSKKAEFPSTDGQGRAYVPIQDKNEIQVIDLQTAETVKAIKVDGCTAPTATRVDEANRRLFVGCRGDKPVLAVVDIDADKVVATQKIGRGVDAVTYNAKEKLVYASNGLDSNLVVIRQNSADTYSTVETVYTRFYARSNAVDPKTGKVYLITSEMNVEGDVWNTKKIKFRPNSFVVMTYAKK